MHLTFTHLVLFMEKMNKKTALLYYLVVGSSYLLALLPFCIIYFLSDLLYILVYHIAGYRREVVAGNLKGSFPEKSDKELKQIECAFYHYFCDYILETLKLTHISREKMMKHMKFHGTAEFARLVKEEQAPFIFVYLGHYGNWEWIASLPYAVPGNLHCAQIYHPLYNKAIDRFFLKLRNQFGGECIPMKSTLRRVIELKRAKQPTVIGFISDQLPKWNSMHFFVPFLHRDTAVFTGAEQIGRQVNAAYFFADITRPKRGYYECTFRRMTPPAEKQTDYDMTALFMQELEGMIKRQPELWLWTHKRWKRTKEEWIERQKKENTHQENTAQK